jgi:hypothetical protein
MSQVICSNCFEVEDTTKRFIELPYVCALCEEDSALALEQDTYNSGVPCQSALDSVQEEQYLDPHCVGKTDPRVHAMHSGDILDQFDADTELINGLTTENDDLKMKLSQANLNIQIQGEIIADLENTVGAYRVIFRIPGC